MKVLQAIFAILLVFSFTSALTAEQAHAKRLGSGKLFGTTYKTAPAPTKKTTTSDSNNSTTTSTTNSTQQKTATAAPAKKGGLMGGMLGGLLAGGLLAALFAGGAFEGLQLMDIVILGGLAFIIFRLMRRARPSDAAAGQQPAYAGVPVSPTPAPQPAFTPSADSASVDADGSDAIPFNLPLGFDAPGFLAGAKQHYRALQEAWNCNDLDKIREYMTPELFAELRSERASLSREPQTELLELDADLVRADQAFGTAEISIRFSGRYRDQGEGADENFVDIWHLTRNYSNATAPWFIAGVETAA